MPTDHSVAHVRGTAVVHLESDLFHLQAAPNLVLYRLVYKRHVLPQTGVLRIGGNSGHAVVEAAVDDENFASLCRGEPYETIRLVVATDDFKENCRLFGRKYRVEHERDCDPNIFTAIQTGMTIDHLIRLGDDTYLLYDYTGRLLPMAMDFCYLSGHFDDRHYDLRAAAAHLWARPDITLVNANNHPIRNVDDAFVPIPAYNHECGSWQLRFRWAPSADDYARIVGKIPDVALTHLFFQECFNLDLFGLRAAGIAKTSTYA